jgi:hypothetical protein
MAKLKKIGVWNLGIVLALAFVVYQLVQIALSYALMPISSYLQGLTLSGNAWILNVIQWILIIILAFILGAILALIYNLLARWIGLKVEISGNKK